jgi:hypothetical protein
MLSYILSIGEIVLKMTFSRVTTMELWLDLKFKWANNIVNAQILGAKMATLCSFRLMNFWRRRCLLRIFLHKGRKVDLRNVICSIEIHICTSFMSKYNSSTFLPSYGLTHKVDRVDTLFIFLNVTWLLDGS